MPAWKNLWLGLFLTLITCGCAAAIEPSTSDEVKAFFVAGREANLLGVMCMSPQHVDLSAYTSFMGVQYPPTDSVEVLSGPPTRPYQAFAMLQGAAPSSQAVAPSLLAQFIDKAKTIGADAIIICPSPGGPGPTPADRPAKVEAVAIKYRVENPGDKKRRP